MREDAASGRPFLKQSEAVRVLLHEAVKKFVAFRIRRNGSKSSEISTSKYPLKPLKHFFFHKTREYESRGEQGTNSRFWVVG